MAANTVVNMQVTHRSGTATVILSERKWKLRVGLVNDPEWVDDRTELQRPFVRRPCVRHLVWYSGRASNHSVCTCARADIAHTIFKHFITVIYRRSFIISYHMPFYNNIMKPYIKWSHIKLFKWKFHSLAIITF